jgi:hypothetical protein
MYKPVRADHVHRLRIARQNILIVPRERQILTGSKTASSLIDVFSAAHGRDRAGIQRHVPT